MTTQTGIVAARTAAEDDFVLPFAIKPLGVRGRIVRLGGLVDRIVRQHDYPAPVSAVLGEAVALAAMLGATLKFDGKFILQTATDGPLDMIVADYRTPGEVRGYARFDAARVAALGAGPPLAEARILGNGHLAMTIDPGGGMERYQGIVPLDGVSLVEAAHAYFRQSEQIPTAIRVAAGEVMTPGTGGAWRAGAVVVQHLPAQGGMSPLPETSGDAPDGHAADEVAEHDDWVKARLLLETVEDHELVDPTLSPERLLYRLYHEDGVTVYPATRLSRYCSCSHERIRSILSTMPAGDRADMVEDGAVSVTCEFCSARYRFTPEEIEPPVSSGSGPQDGA